MNPAIDSPVHDAAAVGKLLNMLCEADRLFCGPPPNPLPGFVTFFDPGWSIVTLRAILGPRTVFSQVLSFGSHPFAAATALPRYRQVRTQPVHGSFRKGYAEQLLLLPQGEEVPAARVVVAALAVHFLATGERLLPDVHVRCGDHDRRGECVFVGGFTTSGLFIYGGGDDTPYPDVGLASARKA